MTWLALPWFVLVTTGSATRMGFVIAAAVAGVAIFGLPGGSLLARIGARRAMLVDAGSYAASFLLVTLFLPRTAPAAQDDASRGLTAGFRFLARDPLLRAWGSMMVLVDASWIVLFAGIPVLVFEQFGRHAATAGWI